MNKLIAIDGETAAGKGTLAKRAATNNELYYLGTGQIFRTIGHLVLNNYVSDASGATNFFLNGRAIYEWDGVDSAVYVDNEDITSELDADEVAVRTSHIARDPSEQSQINGLIRDFGRSILENEGMISEGRNTATALFPEHDLAFYITADVTIRAQRRYETHLREGREVTYDQVLQDLISRDERDKNRKTNPLVPAPDAIVIDTSMITIQYALDQIQHHITGEAPNVKTK